MLLRKCAGPRWKGLWTLPLAGDAGTGELPLFEMRHSVTRFVIHLKVFSGPAPAVLAPDNSYQRIEDLPRLPMPTPHRRSVDALLKGYGDPDLVGRGSGMAVDRRKAGER